MVSEEILKKVRKVEIISKKISNETFAGEYHSAFKGRGMEFAEVREYQIGDDIRFIDWNVSSRMGKLFVKQFTEERELSLILAIDLSASLNFFSELKSKKEIAAEISAIIAFTAMLNKDKVGLLIFTNEIELYVPPKKGKTHLLRIIREILNFSPQSNGTSINGGLTYLSKILKKKSIIFLLSDFIDTNFTRSIKIISKKHDLVAINISDKRELNIPDKGLFLLRDIETDEDFYIDFSSVSDRKYFNNIIKRNDFELKTLLKKNKVDIIEISGDDDYEKPLYNFFLKRRKQLSR
jgi:uncharacterized protein (DUF58 family)